MMPEDTNESGLSPEMAQKISRLRQNPRKQIFLDRLLEKRAAAVDDAERERIDKMIVQLARPNYFGFAMVAVFVAIVAVGVWDWNQDRILAEEVARGIPATAKIERIEPGGCLVSNKGSECLRLVLTVYPSGEAPFRAELVHDVPSMWMSRVQPGNWITVSLHRSDSQKVMFDEAALQQPPPAPVRR